RLRRATAIETGLFEIQAQNAACSERPQTTTEMLDLASTFLRLSDLDDKIFERLGRYEMALWRQARQIMFSLELLQNRGSSALRSRPLSWPRWPTRSPII